MGKRSAYLNIRAISIHCSGSTIDPGAAKYKRLSPAAINNDKLLFRLLANEETPVKNWPRYKKEWVSRRHGLETKWDQSLFFDRLEHLRRALISIRYVKGRKHLRETFYPSASFPFAKAESFKEKLARSVKDDFLTKLFREQRKRGKDQEYIGKTYAKQRLADVKKASIWSALNALDIGHSGPRLVLEYRDVYRKEGGPIAKWWGSIRDKRPAGLVLYREWYDKVYMNGLMFHGQRRNVVVDAELEKTTADGIKVYRTQTILFGGEDFPYAVKWVKMETVVAARNVEGRWYAAMRLSDVDAVVKDVREKILHRLAERFKGKAAA